MNQIRLFRYSSINGNLRSILSNKTVYVASPEELNDPFESTIQFTDEKYISHYLKEVNRLQSPSVSLFSQEDIEKLTTLHRNIRKVVLPETTVEYNKERFSRLRYGVFSMSSDPESILLWAYYGNGHKGICLEYDVPDALVNRTVHKVLYVSQLLPIDVAGAKYIANAIKMLRKSDLWERESEWRLISEKYSQEIPCPFELCGVRFGLKTSTEDIADISGILDSHYPGIQKMKADFVEENFKIR